MGVSIPAKDQNQSKRTKGGEFLIKETAPESIFIAEELTEEQKMMRQAMVDFIDQEIEPHFELVDSVKGAKEFAPRLLEKAGDYGFLGIGVPEEYGGMESDFVTTLSNNEVGGGAYSMSLAIGVQTSIGIAPILLYGNPSQKAKYLPKLVTGEWKTCYCLTEPSSGSDANSAKSTAKLSEDGKNYILNGQKMWITNGGFANIFIVFARIDQDKNLSAFIVEENYGGISRGAEEKKMGIKGSSTRQLFFNNVPVPVENLLGERNGGFKIAVNVLNTGRIKLSSSSVGVCKKALGFAVKYANERVQFKQPISKFGAIQHKIAEMATKTYVGESALYRVGHDIDLTHDEMVAGGMKPEWAKTKSVEAYALECAILKVFNTEAKAFVVDEGVQIHGGMGFSAETRIETMYRDARISRIFEGTNEINRMLVVDMLLRKAMRGELDLFTHAMAAGQALMSGKSTQTANEADYLGAEKQLLSNLKQATLIVLGKAAQDLSTKLKQEQEILMNIADMLIQVYMLESALLRTQKLIDQTGEVVNSYQVDMLRIFAHDAVRKVSQAGHEALYGFTEGSTQKMMLSGLRRLTRIEPINLKVLRRRVAEKIIEANSYCF